MLTKKTPEVVVITGATAGVGRATARKFAKHGAHIGLIARGADRLADTRREVEELGGKAVGIVCDVADYRQVKMAADRIVQVFGAIDVWINNAMVTVMAEISETDPEEFRRVTAVTYLGTVYGTKVALDHMIPRNKGKIVQVGSALAYRGIPLQAAYCAAKHAVQGFCDSLHTELMHNESGIELSSVHLPAMNTPQFEWSRAHVTQHPQPVPPIYEPEVAADAIYFAAHHARREMWVGYPTVKAVLGSRFANRVADRVLAESGYEDQLNPQMDFRPSRPNNLWFPVKGHYAARGPFSDIARRRSPQLWASKHRKGLAAFAGTVAAAIGLYAVLKPLT